MEGLYQEPWYRKSDYRKLNGFSYPLDPCQFVLCFYLRYQIFASNIHNYYHNIICNNNIPAKEEIIILDVTLYPLVIDNDYCNICNIHVDLGTKHCRICNKCVPKWDHHCYYINNCVARDQNFFLYLILLIITIMMSVTLMAYGIYLLVIFYKLSLDERKEYAIIFVQVDNYMYIIYVNVIIFINFCILLKVFSKLCRALFYK
ncbi:unnamed protein product [Gordionus sp. m RMFG-2023]